MTRIVIHNIFGKKPVLIDIFPIIVYNHENKIRKWQEMASMKTCKEMASIWNVTERTVTNFCKNGKIPGAVKEGKSWKIPDDVRKPDDGRISSGKYVKKAAGAQRKPLPVGISDYIRGPVGILLCR